MKPRSPRVREYMSRQVIYVRPEETVARVIRRIRESGHDGFPVVGRGRRLVGYVSSKDLLMRDLHEPVARAMTPGPLVAHPDMALSDAARVIFRAGISKLPVADDAGRLVGIVTNIDVLRSQIERVDERKVAEIRRRLQRRGFRVRLRRARVPVESLVPTQGRIYADELQGRMYEIERGLAEPVMAVRSPRKPDPMGRERLLLADGHHRAVAALRLRRRTVDAYVFELDREGTTGLERPGLRSLWDVRVEDEAAHPLVAATERFRPGLRRRAMSRQRSNRPLPA